MPYFRTCGIDGVRDCFGVVFGAASRDAEDDLGVSDGLLEFATLYRTVAIPIGLT